MRHWVEIELPPDGKAIWAGMGDYLIFSPDRKHQVKLRHEGEPPHGDSYHQVSINEKLFPGYAWGCMFAASPDSRYAAFSWMENRYQRKTVAVDLMETKFFVLPAYIYDFLFDWPRIIGVGAQAAGLVYEFTGHEQWFSY